MAVLLPWMLLVLASGGFHNHSFACPGVCCSLSCPPYLGQTETCQLSEDEATSEVRICTACLWQMHSTASPPSGLEQASIESVAPHAATAPSCSELDPSIVFDPRAPPLS